MALKIRLTRIGATHQPHYRIVIAEARSRRDGAPVETLGTYDPRTKGQQVNLDTIHAIIKRHRRAAASAPAAAPTTV